MMWPTLLAQEMVIGYFPSNWVLFQFRASLSAR